MSKSNNSTGSDENIRNCIVNPLATIDGPDITSVNKEGYRETQHDAANETKNTAIHDNHSSDVPVLEDSKARIQKNNSKLKRNKDECQYQFPFLLHNFVTEISQKTNNEIVKWADDGESFFMDRSHPDLPSLLKKFFGHDKHESLRRQLNMYGFKLINGNFTRQGSYPFRRFSCKEDLLKIKPRPKRSRAKAHENIRNKDQYDSNVFADDANSINSAEPSRTRIRIEPTQEQIDAITGTVDDIDRKKNSCDILDGVYISKTSEYDSELSTYATLETDKKHADDNNEIYGEYNMHSDTEENSNTPDTEFKPPDPSFHVFQRVYAADKDGLLYEAVIRRHLYGPQYHQQIEMGLVTSQSEADILLKKAQDHDPIPMWHYFVHYSFWNVNFDRWVPECYVYEKTENVKSFADRLMKEHKALQLEMRRNLKGKKSFQTVNGAKFLREWKNRMLKITEEMKFQHTDKHLNTGVKGISEDSNLNKNKVVFESRNTAERIAPGRNDERETTWTKASLLMEKSLRDKSLSTKRKISEANAIPLPFALKKIMVESWEIISQCRMMSSLPTPMTIRQALDLYLISKNVHTVKVDASSENVATVAIHEKVGSSEATTEPEVISDKQLEVDSRQQDWIDMADGVAMLFDEALPLHLLYREEIPQFRTLDEIPEYSMKSYSEIYGCEHLLRLFVRLPNMLSDELNETETRPILAKVNDFIRFLHKNQGTLFNHSHRKLNEMEERELRKLQNAEGKRLRNTVKEGDCTTPSRKKSRSKT